MVCPVRNRKVQTKEPLCIDMIEVPASLKDLSPSRPSQKALLGRHIEAGIHAEAGPSKGQQSPGGIHSRPPIKQIPRLFSLFVFAFVHFLYPAQVLRVLDLAVELPIDGAHEEDSERHDAAGGECGEGVDFRFVVVEGEGEAVAEPGEA